MSVSTSNGDVVMVYSGEAYNFQGVRDELVKRAETFTASSNTEGVLRGYLQWGRGTGRPAQRHVRLRHLGLADAQAGHDPRSDGHHAGLLLPHR